MMIKYILIIIILNIYVFEILAFRAFSISKLPLKSHESLLEKMQKKGLIIPGIRSTIFLHNTYWKRNTCPKYGMIYLKSYSFFNLFDYNWPVGRDVMDNSTNELIFRHARFFNKYYKHPFLNKCCNCIENKRNIECFRCFKETEYYENDIFSGSTLKLPEDFNNTNYIINSKDGKLFILPNNSYKVEL